MSIIAVALDIITNGKFLGLFKMHPEPEEEPERPSGLERIDRLIKEHEVKHNKIKEIQGEIDSLLLYYQIDVYDPNCRDVEMSQKDFTQLTRQVERLNMILNPSWTPPPRHMATVLHYMGAYGDIVIKPK